MFSDKKYRRETWEKKNNSGGSPPSRPTPGLVVMFVFVKGVSNLRHMDST